MMSANSNTLSLLLATCLLALLIALTSCADQQQQQQQQPKADSDLEYFPFAQDDCRSDEVKTVGLLPECEPSCENRKPICSRVFMIMDYVPCFCKKPLLRNKATGECVMAQDCPRQQ